MKQGLSSVVASVIVIAIALVAVAIIAITLQRSASNALDQPNTNQYLINLDVPLGSVFVNQQTKEVTFLVERRAGQGDLQGFIIVLEDNQGQSQTVRDYETRVVHELETFRATFYHQLNGVITRITIAPVVLTTRGDRTPGASLPPIIIGTNGYAQTSGSQTTATQPAVGNPIGECNDNQDNDGDGLKDWPIDPGCINALSTENAQSWTPKTMFAVHGGQYAVDPAQPFGVNGQGVLHDNMIIAFPLWRNPCSYAGIVGRGTGIEPTPLDAKTYLDQLPEGKKAIFSWKYEFNCAGGQNSWVHPADKTRDPLTGQPTQYQSIWIDNWRDEVRSRFDSFFSAFHAAGGEVDILFFDFESGLSTSQAGSFGGEAWYNAIEQDPRFTQVDTQYAQTDARYRAAREALGIGNAPWQTLAQITTDNAYSFQNNCNGHPCYYLIWNQFMGDRFNAYFDQATFDIVKQYFPDITGSNFAASHYNPEYRYLEQNGHSNDYCAENPFYCSPRDNVIGTHQQPAIGYQDTVPLIGGNPTSLDHYDIYFNTPFNRLKYQLNRVSIAALSSPELPLSPITSCKRYSGFTYYEEEMLHAMLLNTDYFVYWVDQVCHFDITDKGVILSNVMKEFDKIAGFEGRQSLITEPTPWGADYILTGMESAVRNIWRFTPEVYTTQHSTQEPLSVQNSLVTTNPPTFKTRQATITFPEGAIYEPSSPASSLGYWIIQPINAPEPIITPDPINSPPRIKIVIRNLGSGNNGQTYSFYFQGGESYDEDGYIAQRAWEFDSNNNGVYELKYQDQNADHLYETIHRDNNQDGTYESVETRNPPIPLPYLQYAPGTTVGARYATQDNEGEQTSIARTFLVQPCGATGQPVCGIVIQATA